MAASDPDYGRWTLRRLNESMVLSDIWSEMIFFSAVAAAVAIVRDKTDVELAIGSQLLTIGGVVLGLVISFRTSSAYERYQDGSRMWTNIHAASRDLAQQIWIHVPDERQPPGSDSTPVLDVIIEKKTMINLIHAFAVAVKHLLRDEPGALYEDLYPHMAVLPESPPGAQYDEDIFPAWYVPPGRRLTSAATERRDVHLRFKEAASICSEGDTPPPPPPLKPARLPPKKTIYNYVPLLRLGRWCIRKVVQKVNGTTDDKKEPENLHPDKKRLAYCDSVESTVPLAIYLYLSSYLAFLVRKRQVEHPTVASMSNSLLVLHDSLTHLERICNGPLPFAYCAHLRATVWMYLFFFPFQIVAPFGYYAIPATCLVTFLLCGFMELGQEIENPFNYDLNDLDLDRYCEMIEKDLHQVTAQPNVEASSFIFTSSNKPFAPHDMRTAEELSPRGGTPAEKLSSQKVPNGAEYVSPGNDTFGGKDALGYTMLRNWVEIQDQGQGAAKKGSK